MLRYGSLGCLATIAYRFTLRTSLLKAPLCGAFCFSVYSVPVSNNIKTMTLPDTLLSETQQLLDDWRDVTGDRNIPEAIQTDIPFVFACSEYVARQCIRFPDRFVELFDSGDLDNAYTDQTYTQRLRQGQDSLTSQTELIPYLRRFRHREMVRIIWRDLTGKADLPEVMRDLSHLAEACTDFALALHHQWLADRFGTPVNKDGVPQHLVVIGMGKLGAHELNLSSDIDLIFAYPEDGDTQGGPRVISNAEFFTKLGQQLNASLSKQTEDGFVFRVDMRLRPFGDSGPLVASFAAMEDYYQIHGREWERYAMIKARVIAGDRESGKELMAMLRPFIYRRYVDYGAYASLREMKAMIQKEVQRKGKEQNIKVGAGGIREIEFIGQVFQLIRGGRDTELQQRSILSVLRNLQSMQVLPEFVVRQLSEAYDFLRRTEHRVQAFRDQQTHVLPDDETGQLRLAVSMGYEDWSSYEQALMLHRINVHEHFEQVFEAPQEQANEDTLVITPLWLGELDDEEAIEQLQELGFEQVDELWRRIKSLHGSRRYQKLSARGRERLDKLMPVLISASKNLAEPAVALLRSLQVIEAIMQRSVYLVLLMENPLALSRLIRLCEASPWITHYLSQHPMLLDDLLNTTTLFAPPDRAHLAEELQRRMQEVGDDEEQAMHALRHFKHTHVLRVAAADLHGYLPLMKVSDHLSWIAEVVLQETLNLAWDHLVEKHGRPVCTSDGEVCDSGFAVIAYGKLGGLELGYGSDLDLVFLHSGESENLQTTGARPVPLGVFFARLGQRMMHILTAMTPAGILYEIDMRLRPDGAAGMLVSSLTAYQAYQQDKAWTWEHQALVRARVVAGDSAIATRFESIRQTVLAQPRDSKTLREEVLTMRHKMRTALCKTKPGEFDLKHSPGGIVDIEFMVQYGVLAWAHQYPVLMKWTDNIRLLDELASTGVMTRQDAEFLSETYRTYRGRIHRLKLQEASTVVPDSEFVKQRAGVRRIWSTWLEAKQEE